MITGENNPLEPPNVPHQQHTQKVQDVNIDWDEMWMGVALKIAQRSRCDNAKVGCVLISGDNQVVSTGFNGPPPNYWPSEQLVEDVRRAGITDITSSCKQWCPRAHKESCDKDSGWMDCPSAHAEINAIARADFSRLVDGTAVVTSGICLGCAKALAAMRIKRVIQLNDGLGGHRSPEVVEWFFANCRIQLSTVTLN